MKIISFAYSCILMKPLVMKEKNIRKNKGCTFKMTNISPTMRSGVSNLVPIQCLDILLLP